MLWGGFLFMFIGRLFCIPWGPDPPKIADLGCNFGTNISIIIIINLKLYLI